ncbi:MAG: DMT family transporter [Pseudomonadota bacterium]
MTTPILASSRLVSRSGLDLLLLGLIWGASFLTIRLALDEVSVLSSVCHRVGWAALILWAVILIQRRSLPKGWTVWAACLGMGVLNNVLPFTLMAWGQLHIETGLTSILNAATAIWGAFAAALCFADERLTLRRLAGILLGFVGVVTIVGPSALGGLDLRSAAQLAVIAGTLSYAAASVWARTFLSSIDPLVAAAGMLTGSSLVMIPLTLALEGNIDLPSTATGAASIAYYAIVSTAFAYILYYRLVRSMGAGGTMLVTLIIPPVAITLGALVLDERLGAQAFAGLGLLAVGLVIVSSARTR